MPPDADNKIRSLPQVDAVLKLPAAVNLISHHGHTLVVETVRNTIASLRANLLANQGAGEADCAPEAVLARVRRAIESSAQPSIRRAVNATGIVLHTGLGRAAMPPAARDAVAGVTGACNVQVDLDSGKRIRREWCVKDIVTELTGAEDVLVVNNNAGATLLVLRALAAGREVIVSRGELVEIGGSFRLPDVMKESGAILREVGATNKTRAADYDKAVTPATALILKVRKSNYRIVGFSQEARLDELVEVGRRRGVPVVDDLGAGAMVNLEQYGLEHETTIRESLATGADLALASADKLIGGPQAGVIVGRKNLVETIKNCPLYRALRVDKMTLAALEATLKLFRAPEMLAREHPVYEALSKTAGAIEEQAAEFAARIRQAQPGWQVDVKQVVARLGGGSLPGSELPSFAVSITAAGLSADELARRLRKAPVPVVSRIEEGAVLLDMRTVRVCELDDVLAACNSHEKQE